MTDTEAGAPARRPRRRWLRWLALACGLPLLVILAMHQDVTWNGARYEVAIGELEPTPWAIVLGASVYRDGRPSDMLRERLETAAELHRRGLVEGILITGDRGPGYDELAVMARELRAAGVPAEAIAEDGDGFRTRASMRNARALGIEKAVVVTNPFHLPRAVFLARSMGIEAVGVPAVRGVDYSLQTLLWHHGREALARVLAWWEVRVG